MTGMPVSIGWSDIALRLAIAIVAGLLIGYNRTEYGKAAGLRTTLLVCLAATVAMIQVNLLLPTAGRATNSFVMNDLMRLPLGILTGVGFIGAGAIIHRDNIVVGVTTAATLWYVTVIGLCLGGGQVAIGITATVIGLVALWALHWLELRLRREHRARVRIELEGAELGEDKLRAILESAGLRVVGTCVAVSAADARREVVFELRQFRLPDETRSPAVCETLAHTVGVAKLEWITSA
jgi:putative Mg2+ transporter-C (MgtC) family protein